MKYKLTALPVDGYHTFYRNELIDCDIFATIINDNQSITTAIAHFSWTPTQPDSPSLYIATDQYPLGGNHYYLMDVNDNLEILTDGFVHTASLSVFGYDDTGRIDVNHPIFMPEFTISRFYINEVHEE